ncbi:hypothetical protein K3495_g12626 [Podosphaera aphanis]|nr:hypothetical protein K3495_g12626 [Podosphaera aphanis]
MSKLNRALLRKCDKALQEANTHVAASESKSKRLKCQLDEAGKEDRPRKKIRLDQNQRFAGVEDIVVPLGHEAVQIENQESSQSNTVIG